MKLDEYLFKNGITLKLFAESIGYVARYLSGVKNGRYPLSRQVYHRVLQATDGLVDMQKERND